MIYNKHATYSAPDVDPATTSGPVYVEGPIEEHVQLRFQDGPLKYWAYSLNTGALLWESEGENYLNHYVARNTAVYEGNLYVSGVSGIIYCYNFQTGLNWTYAVEDPYSEIQWANNWWGTYNSLPAENSTIAMRSTLPLIQDHAVHHTSASTQQPEK